MLCVQCVFFSSRRRHTRCALVTGVQTCALPICAGHLPRDSGNSDCTKVGMKRRQASKIAEILERVAGIEPASQAWKASALPLSYTRMAVWAHCHQKGHLVNMDFVSFCSNPRSEEHTSELQSLMRNSYAVFCVKKQNESTRRGDRH